MKLQIRKSNKDLEVEVWNLKHPVGQAVEVTRDNGEKILTRTTSTAWVLSGHTPVVFLDGISGCYLLSRVKAVIG
jgi:hypothetical protein